MADTNKTRLNSLEVYQILDEIGVLNERHTENYKAKRMKLAEIAEGMNDHAKLQLHQNLQKSVKQLKDLSWITRIIVKAFGKRLEAEDANLKMSAYTLRGKLYIDEYTPANQAPEQPKLNKQLQAKRRGTAKRQNNTLNGDTKGI